MSTDEAAKSREGSELIIATVKSWLVAPARETVAATVIRLANTLVAKVKFNAGRSTLRTVTAATAPNCPGALTERVTRASASTTPFTRGCTVKSAEAAPAGIMTRFVTSNLSGRLFVMATARLVLKAPFR